MIKGEKLTPGRLGPQVVKAFAVRCVSLAVLLTVVVAASAAADSFTWVGPNALLGTGGSRALPTVSCPTTSQCTTVDGSGEQITYNPSTGTVATRTAIDGIGTVSSISCPSTAQCTAVDNGGNEITFDPITGAINSAERNTVDVGFHVTGVSCPSGTLCAAVDNHGQEVSFDPASGSILGAVTSIDGTTPLTAVSCSVGSAQCAAVDNTGNLIVFTASATPSPATPHDIDGSTPLTSVSCPSTTLCAAVDGSGNEDAVTLASGAVASSSGTQIDTNGGNPVSLNSVSCPSAGQCVAVDSLGNELTYTPSSTPAAVTSSIDGTTVINAVSCPAGASSCGAVDNHAHALDFTTSGTVQGLHGIVASAISGMACPTRTQCTAISAGADEVTFDPTTGTINGGGVQAVDTSGNPLASISCVAATECTAVDSGGNEVTFDPANGNLIANGFVSVDSSALRSVACQTVSGVNQCTAVDNAGNEVTFNPDTSQINNAGLSPVDNSGGALQSVACPTGTQCTAVDSGGREVTFNPVTGLFYTTQQAVTVDSGTGNDLLSIACPSSTQCTAVDHGGYVVTFNNPATSPPTGVARQDLESASTSISLDAISCPTTTQCTAVDSFGREATFNPNSTPLNAGLLVPLAGANSLDAVACQSTSICVTGDSDGNAFSGIEPPADSTLPTLPATAQQGNSVSETNGSWTNFPTGYGYIWNDCTSATDTTACTAIPGATAAQYTPGVNDIGQYLRVQETASNAGGPGAPVLSAATAQVTPSPAVNTAAPATSSASGFDQEGDQLTAVQGTWTEASSAPLTYHYQWEDCNTSGSGCTSISGAAAGTYTPGAGDIGHTLRVTEVADNGGTPLPSPVASIATDVIEPAAAANTTPPSIVGPAVQQGQTLTEKHGTWTNSGTSTSYTYQWEDCDATGANCAPISGATGATYTPSITDVGETLVVQETAANGGLPVAGAASSAPTSAVLPTPPSNISPPTIGGAIEQGQSLSEGHGIWSSGVDAPTGYSYQWEDCSASGTNCARIAGATSPTYTPVSSDVGHALVVLETATNAGGASTPVASAPTAPAAPAPAPPIQAISKSATQIHTTSATIHAQLATRSLGVSWQFVYGTTTRYSSGTPVQTIAAGGAAQRQVSVTISNLKPGTKYHFRVVETVAPGPFAPAATAYGQDLTFSSTSLGKIALGHKRLTVTPAGKLAVPLKCESAVACVDRFSIETSTQVGSGHHVGKVLCDTDFTQLAAGSSHNVSITLANGCLSLLQSAPGHQIAATFSTRPRSGQLGLVQTITLVEGTVTKSRTQGATRRR